MSTFDPILKAAEAPKGEDSKLHTAATVVPLRNSAEGIELLLLRRNPELRFLGGAWVFPGGRIDAQDFSSSERSEAALIQAARRAAVRETLEEAGINILERDLAHFSRWIPPTKVVVKRFETWFFAVALEGEMEVVVDGEEIDSFAWFTPQRALAAQHAGDIVLAPPTYITIQQMSVFPDTGAALAELEAREVDVFSGRIVKCEQGAIFLYAGDVAYEDGELEQEGPRHRISLLPDGWRYERSPAQG
jgi:8-oxo-dGTP pyrophosphatase MutT (NUDIX family)